MHAGSLIGIGLAAAMLALWWCAWSVVLRWLRVLWVCRIAALSAGLGIGLFWTAEPARDLFMESQDYSVYWAAFFVLVLLWAAAVHFAARKVLEQQAWAARGAILPLDVSRLATLRQRYAPAAAWMPRLLGLLCLAAVWVGVWGPHRDVAPIRDAFGLRDPAVLLWPTAACCLLYAVYVLFRRRMIEPDARPLGQYLRDVLAGRDGTLLSEAGAFWVAGLATAEGRAGRGRRLRWDVLAVALLAAQALAWFWAIAAPQWIAEHASRAQFVVLMLALPVSLLSFLSALSHQWRVPVVGSVLLALAVATGSSPHVHDLRIAPTRAAFRQMGLADAVRTWTALNCPEALQGGARRCGARPVIVASAGGASRAAFFTATVVGELIDEGSVDLRHRLFAISGVSGGSVGAVVIRAALADAGPSGRAPCARLDRNWFGPSDDYGSAPGQKEITWKVCLQAILAGDLLSPAFVGLAARDLFGFLGIDDRAVLLEQALERRYALLVPGSGGLGRLVGQVEDGAGPTWAPLLLLNATSVADGRRMIISDLQPLACRDGTERRLFPLALDLFEAIAGAAGGCGSGSIGVGAGVRLSTAAAASARFPVVSPQAAVRDQAGERLRALLVDGGYFENDGLTTARELAEALLDFGLRPTILRVTNQPVPEASGPAGVAPGAASPRLTWHDAVTVPFDALIASREGQAEEAAFRASHVDGVLAVTFSVHDRVPVLDPGQPCSVVSPGTVIPAAAPMKDVSMSWWLSGAVQGYLDRQLCHPDSVAAFRALREASASD